MSSPSVAVRLLLLVSLLCGTVHADEGKALSLRECIDAAMLANRDLAAARARHEIALAGVEIAGELPNPELEGNRTSSTPRPTFMIKQHLPLWGTRSAAIGVARGELGLADLEIEAAELELRHDVRVQYFTLLYTERIRDIAGLTVEGQVTLLEATEARFELGDVPEVEVKQTRLLLERARALAVAAESQVRNARAQLNLSLGRGASSPLALSGALDERPVLETAEQLLERAQREGRDARSLRQRTATEEARLRLARTGRFPDVTAGAGIEFNDPSFDSAPQYSLTLGLPLLNRKRGEQAEARATLHRLDLEQDALKARLAVTISSALARIEAAEGQVELYSRHLVPSATEVLDLYRDAYREGSIGLPSVIEAGRAAREVQSESSRALLDWQTAVADLEQEVGMAISAGEK